MRGLSPHRSNWYRECTCKDVTQHIPALCLPASVWKTTQSESQWGLHKNVGFKVTFVHVEKACHDNKLTCLLTQHFPYYIQLQNQHHIKYQHLLKKKYVCPHPSCGRLFRLQKQLLRHAKHHTGLCTCGRPWLVWWTTNVHHSSVFAIADQRDYICEFCARAFKSSHNLAVHRMIHTGEKPLQSVARVHSFFWLWHISNVPFRIHLFWFSTLFPPGVKSAASHVVRRHRSTGTWRSTTQTPPTSSPAPYAARSLRRKTA